MTDPLPAAAPPRRARRLLLAMLALFAAATAAYVLIPGGMAANASLGAPLPDVPVGLLALANVALVIVLYGALAFAGDAFARASALPGALAARSTVATLLWRPLAIGVAVGVGMVAADRGIAALSPAFPGFPHPAFPASLLASLTAGIGEEIAFRLFVLSLWVWLLTRLLRALRVTRGRGVVLLVANLVAALAFAAGHLGSAMVLAGASQPLDLPAAELVALAVLNGGLGLVAGRAYLRHGLLAASAIHFWADIVWHVLYPALGGALL